jgi:hypothetical protein
MVMATVKRHLGVLALAALVAVLALVLMSLTSGSNAPAPGHAQGSPAQHRVVKNHARHHATHKAQRLAAGRQGEPAGQNEPGNGTGEAPENGTEAPESNAPEPNEPVPGHEDAVGADHQCPPSCDTASGEIG